MGSYIIFVIYLITNKLKLTEHIINLSIFFYSKVLFNKKKWISKGRKISKL